MQRYGNSGNYGNLAPAWSDSYTTITGLTKIVSRCLSAYGNSTVYNRSPLEDEGSEEEEAVDGVDDDEWG